MFTNEFDRRSFMSTMGKGIGLAALTTVSLASMLDDLHAAARKVEHLTPEQAAADEDFWFEIQQAFSVTRSIINLNNGGVCPSPRIVTEALVRYQWQQEELPAYVMWQILEPRVENVREGLARMFGADKEEIAITRNASESLENILFGMDFKSGDEIVTTAQDYPRMITTLHQREAREGLVLKTVPIPTPPDDPAELVRAFEKAITGRTKLFLLSHINFTNGQIMPVREICALARAHGIESIVDGAHAFAHLAFTQADLGCDYYGTSLHKWTYAPKGTGLLFVRREKIERIWPLMAAEKKNAADIRKFEEIGTHSAAPRLAIGEALLFHNGIGAQRKEARLRYLARYWMRRVKDLPNVVFHTSFDDRQSCAIATVEITGIEPGALSGHLMDKKKIFTTTISNDAFKGIRITPNVYTTLTELDRFCETFETIARKGLPK
ncbi:MAG: aminotransferase class V-fold PLP-dependent enzyme [Ignavibacteria bacterium]|nr:aminotransferase class V-fold PLP-dependent enzyme [Ignavibacteria bacterium]